MRMREVQVSQEYIDTLCEKMLEWVEDKDSYTIPQFLQWKGIGYPYLKYLIHHNPKLCNTFEVMKAIINNRWFHLAMNEENLPHHQAKMLMRYLRLYDSHAIDVEEEIKKRVAEVEQQTHMQYVSKNYDGSKLTGKFSKIYEGNVNKRRSQKET